MPNIGDKLKGKYWSGENYGWQSKATHDKLKQEGKFRAGTQEIDRVVSSGMQWATQNVPGVVNAVSSGLKTVGGAVGFAAQKLEESSPVGEALVKGTKGALDLYDQGVEFVSEKTNIDKRLVGLAGDVAISAAGGAAFKGAKVALAAPKSIGAAGNPAKGLAGALRKATGQLKDYDIIEPPTLLNSLNGSIRFSPPQLAYQATEPFQGLRISDEFSTFVNQKVRREARPKLPSEMAESYRSYGQDLLQSQGTLKGHMKVNYAGQEFGLKSNTQTLASGEPSIKVRSKATRTAQDAKRQLMEVEQTIGTNEFKVGHHRAELDLIHRVMEGLNSSSRKSFVKTTNNQFTNLISGNKLANLIGPNGELPKPIHDAIHNKLREAGLDPRKMDFRTATYKQRLQFMREVDYVLRDIDKFVFEQMQAR